MNSIRNYIFGGEKSQVVASPEILTRAQLKKTLREVSIAEGNRRENCYSLTISGIKLI